MYAYMCIYICVCVCVCRVCVFVSVEEETEREREISKNEAYERVISMYNLLRTFPFYVIHESNNISN